MKKLLILCLLIVLCNVTIHAQCTSFEQFYNYYPDYSFGHTIINTEDGGCLSVSSGYKDTLGPRVTLDVLMVKTDACGNEQWKKHYGLINQYDDAKMVAENEAGEFIIAGESSNMKAPTNMHAMKYSKDGDLIWDTIYSGTQISGTSDMIKRPNKDRYVITGQIQYGSTARGYIVEIDEHGIEKRSKVLDHPVLNANHTLYMDATRIFALSDSAYLILSTTADSLYFVRTDTNFNILSVKSLYTDTIVKFSSFFDAALSYDKRYVAISADIEIKNDWLKGRHIIKMDLNGNVAALFKLPADSFARLSYLIPTHDNGYLSGAGLLKLDSNLNFQWFKNSRGSFRSAIQSDDGSYIASGTSDIRTLKPDGTWIDELYVVKTDSNGNFIPTGIREDNPFTTDLRFTVYPNPASDQIRINTGLSQKYTVRVFDITGKKMIQTSLIDDNEVINTSFMPQGIYVVQLFDSNQSVVTSQKLSILR